MKIKCSLIVVTIFVCFSQNVSGQSFGIGSLAQSALDTTKGVLKKIPESIPSPQTLFTTSVNVVAGYPFEVAIKAINLFCKIYQKYFNYVKFTKNIFNNTRLRRTIRPIDKTKSSTKFG